MACAPLLGAGAFAVLRWVDWGTSRSADASGGAAELAVWQVLVAASVVVWTVLAAVGLRLLRELTTPIDSWPAVPWRETVAFVVFVYVVIGAVLVVAGVAGLRNPYVMDGQNWKIPFFHLVAGVAILPLLLVLKQIELRAARDAGWSARVRDIERTQVLRRSLQTATASLGVVIALAVIATGALRQATTAARLTPVPDAFVLVYGGWFTGIVAAIYLHVFSALEARGRWILTIAARLPDPDPKTGDVFTAHRTLRAELAQELELGGDARRNLESLIAVLAPLTAALLTRLGGL